MNPSHHLHSALLSAAGFRHAFFTRLGGVSSGAFGSLNVSPAVGDLAEHVVENRRRAAEVLGLTDARVYVPRQVHARGLIVVDGSRSAAEIATCAADAIISDGPGLACAVRTADCVPLLIGDEKTRRVAAVHAGWRGVVQRIAAAVVEAFVQRGSRPEHLIAAIGPHISLEAFEVGPEVARELSAASDAEQPVVASEGEKPHADLSRILIAQLVALGVPRPRIDVLPACTFHDTTRFFSYRRDGQHSGRQLSAIVSEAIVSGGVAGEAASRSEAVPVSGARTR